MKEIFQCYHNYEILRFKSEKLNKKNCAKKKSFDSHFSLIKFFLKSEISSASIPSKSSSFYFTSCGMKQNYYTLLRALRTVPTHVFINYRQDFHHLVIIVDFSILLLLVQHFYNSIIL